MMRKYTWEFNSDAEIWGNDICETIADCIEAAKQTIENDEHGYAESPTVVYIGESVPFTISVDSETTLDALEEQADEFCGEAAEGWNAYNHKKRDEINELDEKLSAVVSDWMKKYGYEPYFYAIENIKEYSLEVQG